MEVAKRGESLLVRCKDSSGAQLLEQALPVSCQLGCLLQGSTLTVGEDVEVSRRGHRVCLLQEQKEKVYQQWRQLDGHQISIPPVTALVSTQCRV